ncbi:acylphosphatase [Salipaludibacillus aurantiacus]|uniref:acylphosphatase n=1 Tax=Salipaludibacillus aurantiacus TaxID=1601833 RepID=A0A1H9SIC9_9BACI|nr:acylphosphatase [Salipaludibacillus aurantiacus]SER84714.1 acylphosphatase [Salipaludibacillus aurantiacus]
MKRFHIIAEGRVQGVGFRYQAQLNAQERNLTGWVKNKLDGTVEMEVQGNEDEIESFMSSLKNLRFPVKIENLQTEEIETAENEKEFSVKG